MHRQPLRAILGHEAEKWENMMQVEIRSRWAQQYIRESGGIMNVTWGMVALG